MANFKKFICLHIFVILFISFNTINAQIIYTDIADATPNATYPLDLNNDTIDDFLIQFVAPNKIMCFPADSNAYAGELIGSDYLPWALSQLNPICDTMQTWYTSINGGLMANSVIAGKWLNATDKYLALKLRVGSNTYYGWARFDVFANSGSFTIKDYAYESTPNKCILAGQTSLGIRELKAQSLFSVYPNPFINNTTISSKYYLKSASISISNSLGQVVKLISKISGNTFTLDCKSLPSGSYFITLYDKQHHFGTQKILIYNNY